MISTNKVITTNTIMKYVNHWLNCGIPFACAMIAAPIPWIHATLNPPIILQTLMYTNMLVFPHRGAAKMMMQAHATIIVPAYARKPGAMTKLCISWMVVTWACFGALRTMIVDPTMHSKHPILPMKDSRSFKKMDDNMAVTTTDYTKLASRCQNEVSNF